MKTVCYNVSDFCTIKSGKRLPAGSDFSDEPTPFKYIRARDIKSGKITLDDVAFIDAETQRRISRYIINQGDIAITIVANIGDVGYATEDCDGINLTENAVRLTNFDENVVCSKYLAYYLGQPSMKTYMENLAAGAAQAKLGIYKIEKMKVQLPEVPIQRAVVEIIEQYDKLIEANNKRIKVLEQMAENLYKEWFVRFRFHGYETAKFENGIPKGWSKQRLDQFGISLDSGSRPSGGIDDSLNEGIPSLGAESVNGMGEFDYNDVKLIPFDYYQKMKRGKSTGSDILVYKDGEYIGKTTIFMNAFPFSQFAVNEHVFLLNANSSEYQLYLYFTLHLHEYYMLMQNLNRNAAQPGLSKPDMNRIKIVVPDIAVIQQFNEIVKPIMDHIFSLASQRNNLVEQRDLLLPRLMSGKLEV